MPSNILITGAHGRNLVLPAPWTERPDEPRKELTSKHPSIAVRTSRLDVTNYHDAFPASGEFAGEFGSLDRVIENAGSGQGGPVVTVHTAARAGVAGPADGIRATALNRPIRATTLYPGVVNSEMNPDPPVSHGPGDGEGNRTGRGPQPACRLGLGGR